MSNASIYIPVDRRQALAGGTDLPDRTEGAALFADISGFTPLTEALAQELGRRRGAEELTKQLNTIYGELVAEVNRYHGSVIGFSGDAITCWLNGDNGLRATACALSMQRVMQQFETIKTPSGLTFPLAIKVAVAAGSARRFTVGDPDIMYLDVLAGATLDRLAAAEHEAGRGEVVVGAEVVENTSGDLQISEWRSGEEPGLEFAVVSGLNREVSIDPWPTFDPETLSEEMLQPWILPETYERVKSGQDKFEAELRPAVALFVHFGGIDYDRDDGAGDKLNAYVRWVQKTVARYDGSLLQLTIGDKGSYIYVAFGAPIAHEDDVARAALAALQLLEKPAHLDFITPPQIGISKGRMRVGPYGSPGRRTYGVLGDHTNLAARLMQNALPGQVLVSLAAQKDAEADFEWEEFPPLRVKGKSEVVTLFRLVAPKARHESHLMESRYALPLVGRQAELAEVENVLDRVAAGKGQIVGITAEAGLGKSRLVAEIVRRVQDRQMDIFTGECQSYSTNISYFVWRSIWQEFFGLDPAWSIGQQVDTLRTQLISVDPALEQRLPLLGIVLNQPYPDNDLTRSMNAELRKASLEALLVDCLMARSRQSPLVLVLDDTHWLDQLSHDLLEVMGRAIINLPVLVVLAFRPPDLERLEAPRVASLPHYTSMPLTDFTADEAARLIRLKLSQLTKGSSEYPAAFLEKITERGQGNPFYIEELINYLHDRGIDPSETRALEQLDLPNSLHSLILSRIDQLSESQKITLKVASIIGRLFQRSWLWGVDPELGDQSRVQADLNGLSRLDLTPIDQVDPEVTYLFKHIVTREVAYESQPFETRALLHGQLGHFIERTYAGELDQHVDLLAYHFDLSRLKEKREQYLRKAGDAARSAYANAAAIDYYRRLLPLLSNADRAGILLNLGEVLELVGQWDEASEQFEQALALAETQGDLGAMAKSLRAEGALLRKKGDYTGAETWLKRARAHYEDQDDLAGAGAVLAELGEVYRLSGDYVEAEQALHESFALTDTETDERARIRARAGVLKSSGTLASMQGDPVRARDLYEESLAILRELGDKSGVASLLNNLAVVAMHQEDYATAQRLYQEGLATVREIGYRWAIAQLLNNLAMVIRYQGDGTTARQLLEESVEIRRMLGDKWGIANSLSSLTNLLVHQGEYEGVWEMLDESLRVCWELGDRLAIAYCLEDFASLAAGTGHPERALRLAGAAAALREDIGGPLPSIEQTALEITLKPAREALDPRTGQTAWDAGYSLSMENAIIEALEPQA